MGRVGNQNVSTYATKSAGLTFLVDTGAEISLIPVGSRPNRNPSDLKLFAANNSPIDTFGEKRLTLDLKLRRPITWTFFVAGVPHPIIGANLLKYYGLVVDLSKQQLIDPLTNLF